MHAGLPTSRKHWEKAEIAGEPHEKHGLPDVEQLLDHLNDARKAAAYGDVEAPDLDAEHIAAQIEEYVHAVAKLVEGAADDAG